MYKPLIRIFKNARTYMDERGLFDKSQAPGYFIEGLLYNVSNTSFRSTYNPSMFEILNWSHQADFKNSFVRMSKRCYLDQLQSNGTLKMRVHFTCDDKTLE